MLSVLGFDHQKYFDHLQANLPLPELTCPDPECRGAVLRSHGSYWRCLDGERVQIRRVRCPECGQTHAVLPEDVCAYRDLTFHAVETALDTETAQAGNSAEMAAGERSANTLGRQRLLGLLPATQGDLWSRLQQVFGTAPGILVRLRRWLWSTYRCFFGSLFRLFRGGQPGCRISRSSTNFGVSPVATY